MAEKKRANGLLVGILIGFFLAQMNMNWMNKNNLYVKPKIPVHGLICNHTITNMDGVGAGLSFDGINKLLIGPPSHSSNGCPQACGCPEKPFDCPRWYNLQDVNASVAEGQLEENQKLFQTILKKRHEQVRSGCFNQSGTTSSGGWCLDEIAIRKTKLLYKKLAISVPKIHAGASQRVVTELANMIQEENITSISDFGAGVGQYKAAILNMRDENTSLSSLKEYNAYDGAGNVEEYTKGFLKFFDLTLPLALPRTDWVMCLDVGEHAPSAYEGIVVRNLHYHNCRGIILSWAILAQGGHAHINNHSNEYVIAIFEQLGYRFDAETSGKFRNLDKNHRWLTHSIMVFRRHQDVC